MGSLDLNAKKLDPYSIIFSGIECLLKGTYLITKDFLAQRCNLWGDHDVNVSLNIALCGTLTMCPEVIPVIWRK
jgi:hypothetical protein